MLISKNVDQSQHISIDVNC